LERPLFPTCQVLRPPPLHHASPLKPRNSHHCHCLIRRHVSKDMFFFPSFFHFFSDQCCRDLFSPHARSSNPHLSTMHHPSNLASPTAAITGTQVKICFFVSFFFIPFLTNVTETLFTPHAGSSTPPPLHHIIPNPLPPPPTLANPHPLAPPKL